MCLVAEVDTLIRKTQICAAIAVLGWGWRLRRRRAHLTERWWGPSRIEGEG